MRFSVAVLSGLVSCVLVISLSLGFVLPAGADAPAGASENGDVNGDTGLDISDVVYILVHLFKGGPAPVPCRESPEALARIAELESQVSTFQGELESSKTALFDAEATITSLTGELALCRSELRDCGRAPNLSDTGQVLCYDTAGNTVSCDNPDWPGQDGSYQAGCQLAGRFVDNGDDTVTDNCTNLMWHKNTVGTSGAGLDWQQALQYCENLELAGFSDWRLPSVTELATLVDYSRGRDSTPIYPVFGGFLGTTWTSTTFAREPRLAWYVYFIDGSLGFEVEKRLGRIVRAVRGPIAR